jgi:hypothetical protein
MDKNKLRSLLKEGKTQNALDSLLEELETKATKKTSPELYNPEFQNKDVFTSSDHTETDEVKEVIVESKNLSAKQKMSLLLEKYGVGSMKELAHEERARFLKELNDPNTKFVKAGALLEDDELFKGTMQINKTQKTAAEANNDKTLSKVRTAREERLSGKSVNAEVESPEDDQVDAEEDVLEPTVQANDKDVVDEKSKKNNDTKDKKGDDTIEKDKKALTKDEHIESVTESLESIFDILKDMKSLREDEVTSKGDAAAKPEATEDSEGDTKEPDTDNDDVYPNDEHKEDEEVEEVVVEEVTSKGDAAAKPEATEDSEGDSEEPKEDNADIYPSDEHTEKEEVEEVVVEDAQIINKKGEIEDVEDEPKPEVKDGEVGVEDHDHADEEGKKVRKEIIEEEVTSKGDIAAKPIATKDDDGSADQPSDDNADVYPADEHKEKEEVEEVIVEDAIQVSENAVFITLPFRKNERFTKKLSEKQQEIVTEALKVVYGVFSGKNLNEEFEVPADSEADLKVFKERIEIVLPVVNPSDEISEENAARLQEALEVLDAILKEMSISGVAATDNHASKATEEITKSAVKGKDDPDKAEQLDNDDLYGDDSKETDDVEEVVVEEVISDKDFKLIVLEMMKDEEYSKEDSLNEGAFDTLR